MPSTNCNDCKFRPYPADNPNVGSGWTVCGKGLDVYYWWVCQFPNVFPRKLNVIYQDRICQLKEGYRPTRFEKILSEEETL